LIELLDTDKTGNKVLMVDSYSYLMNGNVWVLVITMNQLILLDVEHKQIMFSVQSNNIKEVVKNENLLIVKLYDHVI
jgi:hypothetical protein